MSDHPLLTLQQVLPVLEQIVQERPDYHYEVISHDDAERVGKDSGQSCVYEFGGAPSCGVGHALFRLGWSVEELAELDKEHDALGSTAISDLTESYYSAENETNTPDMPPLIACDVRARYLLSKFQQHQDAGIPWGDCLTKAKQETAEVYSDLDL